MSTLYDALTQKDTLTDLESSIADYIMNNSELVQSISIQQLALNTHTSPASITRFCKKLGVSGFKEFRYRFQQTINMHLLTDKTTDSSLFTNQNSELDMIDKIGTLQRNAIAMTQISLQPSTIKEAVSLIINADNILGIGISDSFIRLSDFTNNMLKINYYIKTAMLQPEQTFLCAQATKNDVVIVISYSGTTAEVLNDARILMTNHVPIIAITAHEKSPLARYAHVVIKIPEFENEDLIMRSLYSKVVIEYTLDVIYSTIYQKNADKNGKHINKTRKQYLNK
ncbi:MurR/RpiR family transcriptional regulator [Erysipelothrix tonsillarum]|uniref:MurR/RpiR family transcriptional regulator n=1 Tax=Erysipelothrix tonsillarum TaxID=38402 RepID=UPI00037AA740|nr:MurR/RpiR family transcriptional regulator [Erysipelothrix tonsillarum]